MTALRSGLVWFTWIGSAVFIPIETYLSFRLSPFFTVMTVVATVGAIVVLVNRERN